MIFIPIKVGECGVLMTTRHELYTFLYLGMLNRPNGPIVHHKHGQVEGAKSYYTNRQLLELLRPDAMRIPYTYDNFEWPHCDVSCEPFFSRGGGGAVT